MRELNYNIAQSRVIPYTSTVQRIVLEGTELFHAVLLEQLREYDQLHFVPHLFLPRCSADCCHVITCDTPQHSDMRDKYITLLSCSPIECIISELHKHFKFYSLVSAVAVVYI